MSSDSLIPGRLIDQRNNSYMRDASEQYFTPSGDVHLGRKQYACLAGQEIYLAHFWKCVQPYTYRQFSLRLETEKAQEL